MKSIWPSLIKFLVFAIITTIATGILALSISNAGFSSGKSKFTAIFSDVAMLADGDDVRIAGVPVGQVTKISVHDRRQAAVEFTVTDRDSLPSTVRAELKFRNLVGRRYIDLTAGAGVAGRPLSSGSTIPITQTQPAVNLTDLFNGFKPLFQELTPSDVNTLADQIIAVFQGQGGTIAQLVSTTGELTNTVADKDAVIGELITNLTGVLTTINQRDKQFTDLLSTTQQLVSGLSANRGTIGSALTSLSTLTSLTNNLLTPTRPALQGDIAALRQLTDDLNRRNRDIASTLQFMPTKIQKIGRLATFGSWFQFYLCGADVTTGVGKGDHLQLSVPLPIPTLNQPLYSNNATRCYRSGKP